MKELHPWNQTAWQKLNGIRTHLPSALLIKGASGIGKLDMAWLFAQSLLCETPAKQGLPCGSCNSCHWFEQGSHPDFRLVQPESMNDNGDTLEKESSKKASREISIAQVRDLAGFANLSSHRGGLRIVLLHPAESMNQNSANAILKSLEEPSNKLLFILVTHKPQQILPTILSRCLALSVAIPDKEISLDWLRQQGVTEPEKALAQSGFVPLQALQFSQEQDESEEVSLLLSALQRPAQMDVFMLAEKLQRSTPGLVIHNLQQWCYDLLRSKLIGDARYFPGQLNILKQLSADLSSKRLFGFLKELQNARRSALHPLNQKLQHESILFSYLQLFNLAKA